MKLLASIFVALTLSGCSLTGFSMGEHHNGSTTQPEGVVYLPNDKVFSGTAYDCTVYKKRAIVAYKAINICTRFGEYAAGPMAADNYMGAYVARRTSLYQYWLMLYCGYDTQEDEKTFGLGYMKTF